MLSLTFLLVLMFVSPGSHFDYLAWGRESCSISFLCICMLILHALLVIFFSSSWCQELAANCDCGNPWNFHLPL